MYPNVDRMKNIRCPILMIQINKTEESVVNYANELYKACRSPQKQWYSLGDGQDSENLNRDEFVETLKAFVER